MKLIDIFYLFTISLFALAFVAAFAHAGYKIWNRILRDRERELPTF